MILRILRQIRYYAFLALAVFFLAFLGGVLVVHNDPEEAQRIMEEMVAYFSQTDGFGPVAVFAFIFFKNAFLSWLMVALGPLLALVPLLLLFTNGEVLGIAFVLIADKEGTGLVLRALLPHGLLELPAFLLSGALGFFLAEKAYKSLKFKEPFGRHYKEAMIFFFKFIFPLLFLAAIVETLITPLFLDF